MSSKPGTVTIHPPPYAQEEGVPVEVPLEKAVAGVPRFPRTSPTANINAGKLFWEMLQSVRVATC